MYCKYIIHTNLVNWLRDQASLSFAFDQSTQSFRVRNDVVPSHYPAFSIWSQSMRDILKRVADHDDPKLQSAQSCLLFHKWHDLINDEHHDVIDQIDESLSDWGYTDFEFLGHGGRAYAFRTIYKPTGERRVLRVEAPHERMVHNRPKHATIAHLYHLAQGNHLQGIKIEVCDEFVPLNKLPDIQKNLHASHAEIVGLARSTNMTFHSRLFDFESEPQNVGITPSGTIVTFDPVLFTGDRAMECHRHFNTPLFLRDASLSQLKLVYGTPAPTHYHKGPQ